MEDQYGMADLRQYISSRPLFPTIPQPPELLSSHRGLSAASHPYDMLIFRSDSATTANTNGAASSSAAVGHCFGGFESGLNGGGSGDGGAGRWPRQETLTLLEIRSRLDPKFKEANQKGPLWDEVSRIMCEEHGYQRSGKKCREKFENLYKYYKKTKEGKAGRQDGKHYRFFRQLEALYGDANTSASMSESHLGAKRALPPKLSETSLSLSNYSDGGDTSSSEGSELDGGGRIKKSGWKVKIKDFIDAQMRKLMEKQEAWMEKMMKTIEERERERMMREEEWRNQDASRVEREQKFWASERAWIEARDVALIDALHKLTGKESAPPPPSENHNEEKWDSVNNYAIKCGKKRKEDSKSCNYFHGNESNSNQGGEVYCDHNNISLNQDHGNSSPNRNDNGGISESCFRYFMGDGYGRIID